MVKTFIMSLNKINTHTHTRARAHTHIHTIEIINVVFSRGSVGVAIYRLSVWQYTVCLSVWQYRSVVSNTQTAWLRWTVQTVRAFPAIFRMP